MNAANQIKDYLLNEYNGGMKQTEMAKRHNVSQQYICRLLSGKRSCEDITIKTLMKMFPAFTLNLNGDGNITQTASHVSVKNGSVNSISVHSPPASFEQIRARIIAALIPLEIPPEALQCVLRTINELDLN